MALKNEPRALFGEDILILNGTDSSSTDAGEAIVFDDSANTSTLVLDGTDSISSNVSEDIILDGTDSSSTDAGDRIVLEDATVAADLDVAILEFPFEQSAQGGFIVLEQSDASEDDLSLNKLKGNTVGEGVVIEEGLVSGIDNKIINGNFAANQRAALFTASYTDGTPITNSDDTYLFDRWKLLSDGNNIVDVHSYGRTMGSRDFGGNSGPAWMPTETSFAMAMDVETANTKFGQAQFIESMNCNDLRGRVCTLSWKARVRNPQTSTSIKAAVIGWFGTSDTITSDIISAWNDEGTDPTLVANAEYLNEPFNILLNGTMQTYTINVSIPTGIKNVIVFIWNDMSNGDVGTTAGDYIFLSDVQLERGEFNNPRFQNETYDKTLRKCQRYYWQSGRSVANYTVVASGVINSATLAWFQIPYLQTMRAGGTVSKNGTVYVFDGGVSKAISDIDGALYANPDSHWFRTTHATGTTQGRGAQIYTNTSTADWVAVDCEL